MPKAVKALAWDDLRLIHAIAKARTLPVAAASLGIDHATVFRRLRQIETALGTPIFERHRSGYVPTSAGSDVVALAGRVDEDVTAVLRRVAGLSPSPAGEVRIATSDALLYDLLLPLLTEFSQRCPEIRLDVVTGNPTLNLSRRDADIAVRATARPPDTLVGRKAARIAWAPYAAAALGAGVDLLAVDTPWVCPGDALASLAVAAHMRTEMQDKRVIARFDTVGGLVAGVESGLGVGYLPCFSGNRHLGLTRLAPPVIGLGTDLWLLTHEDLRQVPRIRLLLDFLAGEIATLRSLIEGT